MNRIAFTRAFAVSATAILLLLLPIATRHGPVREVSDTSRTSTAPRLDAALGAYRAERPGEFEAVFATQGPAVVVQADYSDLAVKMTALGYGDAPARLVDDTLVYAAERAPLAVTYQVRSDGVKEEVAVPTADVASASRFLWQLDLGDALEARLEIDGSIGIYGPEPALSRRIQIGDESSRAAIATARKNAAKTTRLYRLPAPVVEDAGGRRLHDAAEFRLDGSVVEVVLRDAATLTFPILVDPAIVVTLAGDFLKGNFEGLVALDTANDSIYRDSLVVGRVGNWGATTAFTTGRYGHATVVYNNRVYVIGGNNTGGDPGPHLSDVQFADINPDGTLSASWTSTTALPEGVYGHAAVAYCGVLFVIGGYNGSGYIGTVRSAPINPDGTLGVWNTTTALGTARSGHTATVLNGFIYVTGGASPGALSSVEYAAINANGTVGSWALATALPGPRVSSAAAAWDGRIYVTGGLDGSSVNQNQVWYASQNADGTLSAWSTAAAFTTARDGHTTVAGNGYLYVIGGAGGGYLNDVQFAPIRANGNIGAWATTTAFTNARYYHTSFLHNYQLYVLGGFSTGPTYYNDVQFAPIDLPGSTGSYTGTASLTTPRYEFGCVAHCGYVYAIGGDNGTKQSAVHYASLNNNGSLGTWTSTTAIPTARSNLRAAVYNGYIYITGGIPNTSEVRYNSINANGTLGATWTTTAALPTVLFSHACVAYNGYLYVLGGNDGSTTIDVVRFAPINSNGTVGTWNTTTTLTTFRQNLVAVACGGFMYVLGGAGAYTTVEYAPINPDGTLGTWTACPSLPSSTSLHAGFAYHGSIYVVGGDPGPSTTVRFARIREDGSLGSWNDAPGFTTGRRQHGAVAWNGFLYVISGYNGTGAEASCESAPIDSHGTVQPWSSMTALPAGARRDIGAAAWNGRLYTVGGANGAGTAQNTVQFNTTNPDGTLGGTWTGTTNLPVAMKEVAVVAYNGYLYQIGGINGSVSNTVRYAQINASDGTLGAWTGTTTLPAARTEVCAVAPSNGYMYVLGGSDNGTTFYNVVDYIAINSNGTLGAAWTGTTALNTPRAESACFVYNGRIYVLGGRNSSGVANDVESAPIQASGTLGSWRREAALPDGRAEFGAVAINGFAYAVGGFGGGTVRHNKTCVAPIFSDGRLGEWTTTDAFTTARSEHGVVMADGGAYLYVLGGYDGGTALGTVFGCQMRTPNCRGHYSHLIDIGGPGNIIDVTTNSTTLGGGIKLDYRIAPAAGAAFGALTSVPDVPLGGNVTINQPGRWIFLNYTIDDRFRAGVNSNISGRDITDFGVNYNLFPNGVASGDQIKNDAVTPIPVGGAVDNGSVYFKGLLSDPDGDNVRLQVEVKAVGTAFDGSGLSTGTFVLSGNVGDVNVSLGEGSYHWRGRAEDSNGNFGPWFNFGGNADPGDADFSIDTTAPDTTIDSGPADPTNDDTPTFAFSSNEPAAMFEVQIDGGPWNPETSPFTTGSLGDGSHTVMVRAKDAAGNLDFTPPSYPFNVDTTPPDTGIVSNPPDPSNDDTPTFDFSSTDASPSFEVQIDGGGFSPSTDPVTISPALSNGPHVLDVRSLDPAGNVDPSPATYAWTVDITAPNTTIDSNPPNPDNNPNPSFTFSSDDPGATFQRQVDGGGFFAAFSPDSPGSLGDGSHTYEVRAIDAAGNVDGSPASYTWTVDTAPPDTSLDSTPPDPTNDTTPTFTFSSPDGGVSFEVAVDGGAWNPEASPFTTGILGDGNHSVQVRAIDAAGNTDTTPAFFSFDVDTTPPTVSVTNPAGGAFAGGSSTGITYSATDANGIAPNSIDLYYSPDGGTSEVSIAADQANSGSYPGWILPTIDSTNVLVRVYATDNAGNVGTNDGGTFEIDSTPPQTTITANPPSLDNNPNPSFSFSSDDPGATFEKSLDGGPFVGTGSPDFIGPLGDGSHTYDVRATDAVGNVDTTPASYTWTVDQTPPDTSIDSSPPSLTNDNTPTFAFSATEGGCTFEVQVDFGGFNPAASPFTTPSLGDGSHSFDVRAIDAAGNMDPAAASYNFDVDTTPPTVSVFSPGGGSAFAGGSSQSISYSTSDAYGIAPNSLDFYYSPDGGTSEVLISSGEADTGFFNPWLLPTIDSTNVIVRIYLTDNAGNTGSGDGTAFEIDSTPPQTTITANPPSLDNNPNPSFSFSSDDPGATFEKSLDGGPFVGTGSPDFIGPLGDGSHTYDVRATDAVGNVDTTPATYTWTVDQTPPDTSIDSSPPSTTNDDTPTFTFSATEGGCTFEVQADFGGFNPAASPFTTPSLTDGGHSFDVRATDAAGNVDSSPANYPFTVDTGPPDTTILAGPPSLTNQPSADFDFVSSDGSDFGSTFAGGLGAFSTASTGGAPAPSVDAGLGLPAGSLNVGGNASGNGEAATNATFNTTGGIVLSAEILLNSTAANTRAWLAYRTGTADAAGPGATWGAGVLLDAATGNADLYVNGALETTVPSVPTGMWHSYMVVIRCDDYVELYRDGALQATSFSTFDKATYNNGRASVGGRQGDTVRVDNLYVQRGFFEIRYDGFPFQLTARPAHSPFLGDGPHTADVRAEDLAGNVDGTPDSYAWTIDATPPNTTIDTNPPFMDNDSTPTFTFSADEPGSTFEVQMDAGGFNPATSPFTSAPLGDGMHTFDVRATDPAGNTDLSPATFNWQIDTAGPAVTVDSGPLNPTASNSGSLFFSSAAPDISSFETSLDGSPFAANTSPQFVGPLLDGSHTFQVRGIDTTGNTGSTASYTWTVDTTPPGTPSITGFPPDPSAATSPTFTFSSSDPDTASFETRVDGGMFAANTSPQTVGPLFTGSHTFDVRAVDAVGNVGSPASYTWTIDSTPPDTSITSNPPFMDSDTTPTFAFTSTEGGSTFQVRMDGGGFVGATSPFTSAPLGDGMHTFDVRAIDPVGNVDATPATYSWQIDTGAPTTTINTTPPNPTNMNGFSFSFSSTATDVSYFETSVDGAAFAANSSPQFVGPLLDGSHTFQARAVDLASNTGPAASFTWTIDTAAPNTTITGFPPAVDANHTPTFTFTSTEGGSFQAQLDGGPFNPVSSPFTTPLLITGGHTINVRATDTAGNQDASPATYSWTIVDPPGAPTGLKAEGLVNPINVFDPNPEFTATFNSSPGDLANKYRIQVSTTSAFTSIAWDSSPTDAGSPMANTPSGGVSPLIPYAGPDLLWNTLYYWRIKFYSSGGLSSAFSTEVASFKMGLPTNPPGTINGTTSILKWSMVGLPANTTLAPANVGGFTGTWYRWNEVTQTNQATTVLDAYRGFMIRTIGQTITLNAGGARQAPLTLSGFSYTAGKVYTGRHYIANPWNGTLNWNATTFAGTIAPVYYYWDGSQWLQYNQSTGLGAAGPNIPPFRGICIRVTGTTGSVTIQPPSAFAAPTMPEPAFTSNYWRLQVRAASGTAEDSYNYLGVHPDAQDGLDDRDIPDNASLDESDWMNAWFDHPEWDDVFVEDMRRTPAVPGSELSWTLSVTTDIDDATEVSFPNADLMPAGWEMTATDLASGTTVTVEPGASLVLPPNPNETSLVEVRARRVDAATPTLRVSAGVRSPGASRILPGEAERVLLQVRVEADLDDLTLNGMNAHVEGRGEPVLVRDVDGDGRWTEVDGVVEDPAAMDELVPENGAADFLVAVRLPESIQPGETFSAWVDPLEVAATDSAGSAVEGTGMPIEGEEMVYEGQPVAASAGSGGGGGGGGCAASQSAAKGFWIAGVVLAIMAAACAAGGRRTARQGGAR